MRKKVSVIGAGFVGATTAMRIIENDLADVVLTDIVGGLAEGKALDMSSSSPIEGFSSSITGTSDLERTKNSDIVVLTAGMARNPGMSRDDLLHKNAAVVKSVVTEVAPLSPEAVLIVVTNPLDVMSHLAFNVSDFPAERVIGMGGVLDSARYRYFISKALSVAPDAVHALVLGGHGDLMVPLPRYSTVSGIPLPQLLSVSDMEAISERTKKGGAEVVQLLKTGSAYYAPSSAVASMVKSILFKRRDIMPCSVYLRGEYGVNDAYCGVPVKLSGKGVKEIVSVDLTPEEEKALHSSANAIKAEVAKLNL